MQNNVTNPNQLIGYSLLSSPTFWLQTALMAAIYFVSGKLSFALSYEHSIVTVVIFAAEGFALAAALILGKRILPGIFLGQFILAYFNELSVLPTLMVSIVNTMEAALAIWLAQRIQLGLRINNMRNLLGLLLLIVLVLQPFSATFGTLSLVLSGVLPWSDYLGSWFAWWFGNSMGQIIITPMILAFFACYQKGCYRKHWHELILICIGFGLLAYLFTLYSATANFALMLAVTTPLVVLLTAYKGVAKASFAVFTLTVVILYQTQQGFGPFQGQGFAQLIELNYYVLSHALLALILGVLFKERKDAEKKLAHMALYDPVTGLFNRNALSQTLSQALPRAKRQNSLVAVGFLDLDGFKEINDTYGHDAGDAVLQTVGHRLQEVTRAENTLIRQGGDEFIIILEDVKELAELEPYLLRLLNLMSQPMPVSGQQIEISCSIGVSVYPINGESMDDLVKRADQAMYQAKNSGKNCFAFAEH